MYVTDQHGVAAPEQSEQSTISNSYIRAEQFRKNMEFHQQVIELCKSLK